MFFARGRWPYWAVPYIRGCHGSQMLNELTNETLVMPASTCDIHFCPFQDCYKGESTRPKASWAITSSQPYVWKLGRVLYLEVILKWSVLLGQVINKVGQTISKHCIVLAIQCHLNLNFKSLCPVHYFDCWLSVNIFLYCFPNENCVLWSLHIGLRWRLPWFERFYTTAAANENFPERFWYGGLDFRYFQHIKTLNWTKPRKNVKNFHFSQELKNHSFLSPKSQNQVDQFMSKMYGAILFPEWLNWGKNL